MSKQEIQTTVKNIIFETALKGKEFSDDDSFFALGINSVSIMQIQIELAKAFKTKLNFRELSRYNTVNKLSEYLAQKLVAGSTV